MNPRVSGRRPWPRRRRVSDREDRGEAGARYRLDEIPNDITRVTPASFEPTIDYVVIKMPRWNFEKFPEADRTLTTQMKSIGEAMAIGRTFKEAFLKGMRSLELGRSGRLWACHDDLQAPDEAALAQLLTRPHDRRSGPCSPPSSAGGASSA